MPSVTTTRAQYALAVLRQGGYATSESHVAALVCGMTAEDSEAKWNPLDTEMDAPGASDYNSAGVKDYPTIEVGLDAVVRTLALAPYAQLRALLRDPGASTEAILQGFLPWTGGNDLWLRVWAGGIDVEQEGAVVVAGSETTPDPSPAPAPPLSPTPGPATMCSPLLPIIRPGDQGQPVRSLQTLLGSGLTVDGAYGAATRAVVDAWAHSKGLDRHGPFDGVIGPEAWQELIGQTVRGADK